MILQNQFIEINPLMFLAFIQMVLIISTIALFILFLFRYIKTHQKMLGYLAVLFFFYLINNILRLAQFFASNQESVKFYFIMAEISGLIMLYSLILLFEIFYRNTQFSNRQTITTISLFTVIGALISNPELEVVPISWGYLVNFQRFSIIMILELVFHIIAVAFLLIILINSRKSAWVQKQKKLITWLLIGSLIGVLLPTLPNVIITEEVSSNQSGFIMEHLFRSIPQSIGILIVGISFLKASKNPWLLQRQKVYFLVVYSNSGLLLYSKTFSKEITADDTFLLAGAFSAVASLISGCTKSTGSVKSILLEGKQLRVINREMFVCALLVEYSTQASEWAHERFSFEFEKKFHTNLSNFDGEISVFNSAEDIIKQYFT